MNSTTINSNVVTNFNTDKIENRKLYLTVFVSIYVQKGADNHNTKHGNHFKTV